MKNSKLYCCFSLPLREFLTEHNIRYEICAVNPNSNKMFWVYIRNEKLNRLLKEWSLKR
ncbi:MAG: hypothetical protein SPI06_08350 [Terrisporobacter sp.]|uniref:hypothetical protein n=1 Tax=Terrisporobacter sp. TaxID=1965305 RepID=UPI002A910568|nr:hypothetical protein [Terrisporobacter sp.]MDY6153409.1 hypothetical protein [Terrisporobacter sp.]